MVDFANPGVLGTAAHFRRTYQTPILAGLSLSLSLSLSLARSLSLSLALARSRSLSLALARSLSCPNALPGMCGCNGEGASTTITCCKCDQ